MPPTLRNAHRLARVAAIALLVAGCSSAASPAAPAASGPLVLATLDPALLPSQTPIPSRSPSPPPSPTPSPTPAPSEIVLPTQAPSTGAIDKLKIGSPYTLVYNPADKALNISFSVQVGGLTVTETMSGREIHQRGNAIGLVYVVELNGVPMNEQVFEAGARGAAANTSGKLTYGTVLGHKVAYIVAKAGAFAMYLRGENIIMVGADGLPLTKTLLQSLITANR
jgi:hypothetical protein